jgi:hypothetical protein
VRVIVVGDLTGCELTLTIDEPALRPALE